MNEPDLDRFSRPLWGEREALRQPSEDEMSDYKEQESEMRVEQQRAKQRTAAVSMDPFYPRQWAEKEYDESLGSPCCGADSYIQDVKDFREGREYSARTCWNCNQIIEEEI